MDFYPRAFRPNALDPWKERSSEMRKAYLVTKKDGDLLDLPKFLSAHTT